MNTFVKMLKTGHPAFLQPNINLTKIRFSDIQYGVRDAALLAFTRDVAKPLGKEEYNRICHGRLNVAEVVQIVQAQ